MKTLSKTTFCCDCGNVIEDADDSNYYLNGERLCPDCYSDDFFTCEYCGKIHQYTDKIEVSNSKGAEAWWCSNCASKHAKQCSHCDEYFTPDAMAHISGNFNLCNNCKDK